MSKRAVISRRRVVVVVVVVSEAGRISCRQGLKRTRIFDKYSDETFMMAGALPGKREKKKKKKKNFRMNSTHPVIIVIISRHTQKVDAQFEMKQFVGGMEEENGITHIRMDPYSPVKNLTGLPKFVSRVGTDRRPAGGTPPCCKACFNWTEYQGARSPSQVKNK